MNMKITPARLSGTVPAVASKSYAHRALIAAAFAEAPTEIILNTSSQDIEATVNCIKALGGRIEKTGTGLKVYPVEEVADKTVLDCGESGSTARFLIPVAAVIGTETIFEGHGRLPERPQKDLVEAITKGGASASADTLPMTVYGGMKPGVYEIAGDISSQYITGLLFAMALLEGESEIVLTSPLQSAPYVDMTLQVLGDFGVKTEKTEKGYRIQGGKITSPGTYTVEGDWSNAAFWLVAARMGCEVTVSGLNNNSLQGDKDILTQMWQKEIDASQIPDLVPILAVGAAAREGRTVIYNAERLRIKESDRLTAVAENLKALGARVNERPDGLEIFGTGRLRGGTVKGCGDHRIVMAMAIAACVCKNPVIIEGAQAVEKSYPGFFEDFIMLGGKADEL